MDNKTALKFILATDKLLNDFGNLTRTPDSKARNIQRAKIDAEKHKMQRVCYDPYLFARTTLGSDKMEYTCLICGKVIGGTTLGHVVNLSENGLIEGDDVESYAVEQLKKYLMMTPPLSEVEIREALRNDLIDFARQR